MATLHALDLSLFILALPEATQLPFVYVQDKALNFMLQT
jgi:hypothetical protein